MSQPTTQALPPALRRIAAKEVAAEYRAERQRLGKELAESEARYAKTYPSLDRERLEKIARHQKLQREADAARGIATVAEDAANTEMHRAFGTRVRLREAILAKADPRLAAILHAAERTLSHFRFARDPDPPMRFVPGLFGPTKRAEVVPGWVPPTPRIAQAREAINTLRAAMELAEQDVPALEAAFYGVAPAEFGAAIRLVVGEE